MNKTAAFPTVECNTVECTVELPLSWQNIGIAGMPANLAISGVLLIYACAWPVAVFLFCELLCSRNSGAALSGRKGTISSEFSASLCGRVTALACC